jgi:hypothetical protein
VGFGPLGGKAVEFPDQFPVYFAAVALISKGGIIEAVAENDGSLFEKRLDHLMDMLCPCCLVKEEFAKRDQLSMVRVEEDLSDLLTNRGASRLPRHLTGNSPSLQVSF